jgi:RNA polymerase primary sigma factor
MRDDRDNQVKMLLRGLKERERKILEFRFGIDMIDNFTLEEVGQKYNLTRERIRQVEAKALETLEHVSRSNHLRIFVGKEPDDV